MILILIAFVIIFGISLYFQNERERKLKNTRQTKAIITYRSKHLPKSGGANITYSVNGKIFNTGIICDCRDLNLNDTVLIKYAVEDPELVKLVDKYYMKKYR